MGAGSVKKTADHELSPPPEEGASDLVRRVVNAAISAIPVAGGPVVELMSILGSPVERRRLDWLTSLAEDLSRLKKQVADLTDQKLSENAAFVTAALQATQMAGRTHKKEKLEALRNAVLNVAAGSAPEDDIQAMFLDAVDSLTATHVRFLSRLGKALIAPEAQSLMETVVERSRKEGRLAAVSGSLSFTREWMPVNTSGGNLLLYVDPFSEPPDVLHPMWPPVLTDVLGWQLLQMLKDLEGRGFVAVHPPADQFTQVTSTRAFAGVSGQGREFLAFITSPLAESDVGERADHAGPDTPA